MAALIAPTSHLPLVDTEFDKRRGERLHNPDMDNYASKSFTNF